MSKRILMGTVEQLDGYIGIRGKLRTFGEHAFGPFQAIDIGKRVYCVGISGVLQMESQEQLEAWFANIRQGVA